MDFETIRYELDDGVVTITLERPDRLNAYTPQMGIEVVAAIDAADADDDVRVVIFTGEGRAFCAGVDLADGGATFERGAASAPKLADGTPRDGSGLVALRMFDCRKPLIAAINGPAVGIGITMTLPMDIRLASTEAKIGFVFTRRGIVPACASSWFLPRLVGIAQTMEWIATGRIFDADEAIRGGLVRSVHEPEALLPAARALAREIADNTAPVSVALSRTLVWNMVAAPHPLVAHEADSRGLYSRGQSADVVEEIESFLEKRAPVFPDRVSADLPDLGIG